LAEVRRFDLGQFRKAEVTPEGYLRADAFATRTGVFRYVLPDGTVRRELRTPDQVYRPDSMKSLAEIGVTNDHPPEMLNANNTGKFAVGFTNNAVESTAPFLKVGMTVTDAQAVKDITANGKAELSCGYTCDVLDEKGVYQGEEYDAVQKNIRYNHLAIVTKGRAGPMARIRLDAADAIQESVDADWDTNYINNLPDSAFAYIESGGDKDADGKTVPRSLRHFPYKNSNGEVDLPHLRNALSRAPQSPFGDEAMSKLQAAAKAAGVGAPAEQPKQDQGGQMAKVKIDAVEYELSEAVASVVSTKMDAFTKAVDGSKKEIESLTGRVDALQSELKAKTEELEKAKTEKLDRAQMLAIAKERLALEGIAKEILGADEKLDALSDSEIKAKVIKKRNPDVAVEGKSEDYLNGRFDVLRETLANGSKDKVADAIKDAPRNDGTVTDAAAARKKMMEDAQNAWKNKVA